jgi:hypothetical protein
MSVKITASVGDVGTISVSGTDVVSLTTTGMSAASGKTLTANALVSGTVEQSIGAALGFRNKIIGGDFTTNPWQRGTSFTGPTGAYTSDRFYCGNNTTGVINVLKTADAPTVAQAGVFTQHCIHVDTTTAAGSISGANACGISQPIEGFNIACCGFGQAGIRYVTLSFWHKHTKTGTYCVSFRNSAANRSYVAEYVQDVTNTWEKAVITIPVDTAGTWLYDNGIGLNIRFAIADGSTYHTSPNSWSAGNYVATANQVNALDNVANDFKLALIQLEAGSVATPFETRSVGQELSLCQRYYYRISPGANKYVAPSGWAASTTAFVGFTKFPVSMRTIPSSLEQSGTAGDYSIVRAGAATTTVCSAVPTLGVVSTEDANTSFTVASGLSNGYSGSAYVTATGYLGWSAEL